MGKIIKFFTILISLVLIVAAGAVAMLAFPVFGNQALIVRSGSMEPNIPVGSVVVVRETSDKVYNVNDVISFKYENMIITHRIVAMENDSGKIFYKTKGDANEEADNWSVPQSDVIGKNYIKLPEFGKILSFARTKYGFPLMIVLPASLVILIEVINIIREIIKNRRKKKEKKFIGIFNKNLGGEENTYRINPNSYFTKKNFYSLKVLIPIIAFGLFIQGTSAFFSDTETSENNLFQAAANFPTPTGTITPTLTPTPTDSTGGVPAECTGMIFNGVPVFGNTGTTNNELIFAVGGGEIDGNAGNDCIIGTSAADEIKGGSGNDVVIGNGGDDTIDGDSGDDTIFGGLGDDTIDGGTGKDFCDGESMRRCEP